MRGRWEREAEVKQGQRDGGKQQGGGRVGKGGGLLSVCVYIHSIGGASIESIRGVFTPRWSHNCLCKCLQGVCAGAMLCIVP